MTLLAHAGPGSTWQAMVVVLVVVLTGTLLLVAAGRFELAAPGDLLVPIAVAAIASSLAPLGHTWLSDAIGVALPIGASVLLGLLLAATTPLELSWRSPLLIGTVVVAIAATALLAAPLTERLHPPEGWEPDPAATALGDG